MSRHINHGTKFFLTKISILLLIFEESRPSLLTMFFSPGAMTPHTKAHYCPPRNNIGRQWRQRCLSRDNIDRRTRADQSRCQLCVLLRAPFTQHTDMCSECRKLVTAFFDVWWWTEYQTRVLHSSTRVGGASCVTREGMFKPLRTGFLLNITCKFSSYLTGGTLRLREKD
jgi:hypothetical protein